MLRLFKLATAAVFWILLELGSSELVAGSWKLVDRSRGAESGKMETGGTQNHRITSRLCKPMLFAINIEDTWMLQNRC